MADWLHPSGDDYFVHGPKHSAFFSTTLDTLLRYQGTETFVTGGFTANDAYIHDLQVVVPSDRVASNEAADRDAALALVRRVLKGDTPGTAAVDFRALVAG